MNIFFLICPIGFEPLLLEELNYKWAKHFPEASFTVVSNEVGGIEIETELEFGLQLNMVLKIPTRILLRLKKQKCRDLPKLFNILKKIKWKDYLKQQNVDFHISARKSRLIHTGRIKNTSIDALKAYFNANKIPQKKELLNAKDQIIFLRFNEDNLDISLDTSGELLHKRDKNSYRGKASIRESFSAALCLKLLGLNHHDQIHFIDPMCGSGTNLLEARDFFTLNRRDFSFQNWINFPEVDHLQDLPSIWNFQSLIGNELDKEVFENVKEQELDIRHGDFFDFSFENTNYLILNPPYGKRIKIDQDKVKYFKSLIGHIKTNIKPDRFGIIIPRDFAGQIHCKERLNFNQNGIKVTFLIF
jgi:putative N6-adenine-specific DNA methylase